MAAEEVEDISTLKSHPVEMRNSFENFPALTVIQKMAGMERR
jgi:hypothetical protein